MKIGALFVLPYLLFGTVAGDWAIGGPDSAGHGRQLLLGGAILLAFFLIGVRAIGRYQRFMGFSRWQWAILPPLALGVGIALRIYAL